MAERGSISRDEMRRHLRERTREAELYYENPAFLKREKENRWNRFRDILSITAFVLCFLLSGMFYAHNYTYTTYSVDEETEMGGMALSSVYTFKDGTVVIGRDSLTYVVGPTIMWTESLTFENPVFVTKGDYFAVCDKNSYKLYVCDKDGIFASVKVSRKICGLDISASGVTAVYTENNEAAYISYFDKYGNRLDVELKTVFSASGYPVHIALSPDGQKLEVLFYSMANGIGESRLVLYDFENGKSSDSYIISDMEDFYDSGTLMVSGTFFDDTHFAAVGDNLLRFASISGTTVSYTDVTLSDKVRSVIFSGTYTVVVEETDEGNVCTVYNEKGTAFSSFAAPDDYDNIQLTDRNIVFTDGARVVYYNLSGRLRYDGELVTEPVSWALNGRSLVINNGTGLQKITFK